jgi:hypothetical protein
MLFGKIVLYQVIQKGEGVNEKKQKNYFSYTVFYSGFCGSAFYGG